MASYIIEDAKDNKWVKIITIHSNNDIDLNSDAFNITVKDQFEYFINDFLSTGDTFELEELFKKDTEPTIEICKNAKSYVLQNCFTCNGIGTITCTACNGFGMIYPPRHPAHPCAECGGHDLTPGRGYITCPTCNGDRYARTICDNEPMYTENYENTIYKYNNSDDLSLIKNGIQFWLEDSKTLKIRVVTKGKSTLNEEGYTIYNPITHDRKDTGYVGFSVAHFIISLNDSENLVFYCFLIPKVETDDPVPEDDDPDYKPHYPEPGFDRVDYDWNQDGKGINNLYVNTTSSFEYTSAYEYKQYQDPSTHKWKTEGPDGLTAYPTPKYIVKSSAFTNDYLFDDYTDDLLNGGESARGFDFVSANVNSYLYNEYTQKKIRLPFDFDEDKQSEEIVYFKSGNEQVFGTVYWHEIIQEIVDTTCSGIVRKNQVKLELEI